MSLLGAKKDEKPARSGGVLLEEPPYYEVWGGLERANTALWVGLWLAITASMIEFALLRVQARRPPVVIRVDAAGAAQVVSDSLRQPPVSEAEIRNFVTLFEKFFTELNSYTYESDLKLAYSMMTPQFQAKAGEQLKRGGVIEGLKANQTKTTLTITEIKVVKDTPLVIDCDVKGYREVASYKPDGSRSEVVFEDEIVLKKVSRSTDAPYGALVQDWVESPFKK